MTQPFWKIINPGPTFAFMRRTIPPSATCENRIISSVTAIDLAPLRMLHNTRVPKELYVVAAWRQEIVHTVSYLTVIWHVALQHRMQCAML